MPIGLPTVELVLLIVDSHALCMSDKARPLTWALEGSLRRPTPYFKCAEI